MKHNIGRLICAIAACLWIIPGACSAQTYYDNERTWSNSDPTLNVRRSEHFRFIWGDGQDSGSSSEYNALTEQLVQGDMQAWEHAYHQIFDAAPGGVGFRAPNESNNPVYRDGKYYRANFTYNNTGIYPGGGWGTQDDYGFPWVAVNPAGMRYDPQPDASFHEYIHTVLINCAGFNNSSEGMWHEATNDWLDDQTYCYAGMGGYASWHNLSLPNGRAYYDAYLFNELLYEDPLLGTPFTVKVWTEANGNNSKGGETMFDAMARLWPAGEADSYNELKDRMGQMAARNVTWDYRFKQYYRPTTSYTASATDWQWRRGTTELVPQPGVSLPSGYSAWYRPPFEQAPCLGGYDICPITLTGKTAGTGNYPISVDFQPLWDSVRKSDWRATFVAVNDAGDARYSNMWNSGVNTIVLSGDENKLYLVISAVPDFQKFDGFAGPLMTDAPTAPQPYRVAFVNTSARPMLVSYGTPNPTTGWAHHSNGGGWVKSSAAVDATAYVGPNAVVYDSAKVQGHARIEDYAIVQGSATVKDYAVVSGHAIVNGSTQVYGNAKVRDWSNVTDSAKVYDNAKILQHAMAAGHGSYYGDGVMKGCAWDWDVDSTTYPAVFGSGIKDADCSNFCQLSKGVLMGWEWGADQARANALADNGYLYCGYDFDRFSPNYALDEYGITYGYLVGSPTIVNGSGTNRGSVLSLDGVGQYVELQRDTSDFRDCTIAVWAKWAGSAADQKIWSMGDGSTKYLCLTPKNSANGKLRFTITDGTTTTNLDGPAEMPSNTWTHVAVVFSGSTPTFTPVNGSNPSTTKWTATATLYVNGASVASAAGVLVPDQCNAPDVAASPACNYVGRGNAGDYFAGQIDEFRVYNKALTASDITALQTLAGGTLATTSDTTAPTPNPATWLVAPKLESGNSVVMSATKGSDASGCVEYYFACTSGGGHDSGWISTNRYFDSGLTRGTTYSYTVQMRDKYGNVGTASTAMSVTVPADIDPPTPNAATFLLPPKGISTTAIKMTATTGTDTSGLVEYKFNRMSPTIATSGWQTNPTWTDSGLASGTTYYYTVQMRDAYNNTGTASAIASAVARDDTPPTRYTYGEWTTFPYGTIDNKISMRARSLRGTTDNGTDNNNDDILSLDIAGETVSYYFHCTSGGGPDSGWQPSNSYTTPVLPDGTYSYQFKIKDASGNETPYSSIQTGSITPTTGYHTCTFAQALTLPDEYLVTFTGTVMRVNSDNYLVRDLSTGNNITVKPHLATNVANALKSVQIQGHLFTLGGVRIVTTATVTSVGNPTTYTISGQVTNTSGAGISGATVYFSDAPNAAVNPVTTATADSNGYYSKAVPNPSSWYVAAGSGVYNTSADRSVSVNGANVGNINFTLTENARISGRVTKKSDGTAISGATVYFSTSPNAFSSPTFTTTTDASGNYSQPVQNATWYVCAGATGYWASADATVVVNAANVSGISFTLKSNTRNIPRTSDLLFSAVTDTFPNSGSTGNWASYLPAGSTLTMMHTPMVDVVNGAKYERNLYADTDGYVWGSAYSSPIAVNGASIVVAVKPSRTTDSGNWRSVVDIFYDRLVLGLRNNDGKVNVRRNGSLDSSSIAIPDGQVTVLSMVVQPDGSYRVWANGTEIAMPNSGTITGGFTSLVPNVAGGYAGYINIGRNNPDDWSTFNGDIGDVFVYKVALTDAERQQLEADLSNKFRGLTISASAGVGGSISPIGLVAMNSGESQTFTITPDTGYVVSSVMVDGVSQGAITSYTFRNVAASHTISATFAKSVASIALLKVEDAGTLVKLTGTETVIYAPKNSSNARTTAWFYIGEAKALGGLKVVDKTSDTLTLGNLITGGLTGYVRKPAGGEVYLELTANPTGSGNTPIPPLGMSNKSVLTDFHALTNAVVVWGKVKSVNSTTFTISDGHSTDVTVNVNGVALPIGFGTTKTAVVIGILSTDATIQAQSVRAVP